MSVNIKTFILNVFFILWRTIFNSLKTCFYSCIEHWNNCAFRSSHVLSIQLRLTKCSNLCDRHEWEISKQRRLPGRSRRLPWVVVGGSWPVPAGSSTAPRCCRCGSESSPIQSCRLWWGRGRLAVPSGGASGAHSAHPRSPASRQITNKTCHFIGQYITPCISTTFGHSIIVSRWPPYTNL